MMILPSTRRPIRMFLLLALAGLTVGLLPAVPVGAQQPPPAAPIETHVDPTRGQDPNGCRWSPDEPGGTEERPYGTIGRALNCIAPGTTVYLHEGVYQERVKFDSPGGQFGNTTDITLTSAPGEARPVIRGGLRILEPDGWTISDLEIVGDGGDYRRTGDHPLKILGGTGWIVEQVEVHDAPTTGLVRIEPNNLNGEPPSDWTIRESCIHGTQRSGGGLYEDHNMYVWAGNGGGSRGGVIEHNIMFGAPNGQNLKLGNREGTEDAWASDNVTVRFNTMSDAVQNMTLVGDTDGAVIERNLFAHVQRDKPWYPNIRGLFLRGDGNRATDNAWSSTSQFVYVGENGRDNENGRIAQSGNLEAAPDFDRKTCSGFVPTNSAATPYGAHASGELPPPPEIPVVRVAGKNRFETAVEVSRSFHDDSDIAVVARADDYPDALSSSALAGLLGAPVLLSGRDQVPDVVMTELNRLGASTVLLMGGEAALSSGVASQLQRAGIGVDRLAGANRFATATTVADRVMEMQAAGTLPRLPSPMSEAILVEGSNPDPSRGWPDAVAAGQLAASTGAPILLTSASSLSDATSDWLATNQPDRVTIVGGTAAVSSRVQAEVEALVDEVARLAGPTRYATAERVAGEVVARDDTGTDPRLRTFVASGLGFPDALAAAPATAVTGGVLVLYGTSTASYDALRKFVAPVEDQAGFEVVVVGGAAAVPTTLEDSWRRDAAG